MIGKLVFKLPEEQVEFDTAQNGWKYKCVIEDLHNWLRQLYKFQNKETVSIEELREKIVEIEQGYNLYD